MRGESASFPLWAWLVFAGLVLGLLFLDLFVLHRRAREVPFREAIWLTAFWIAVSLSFGGFIWAIAGGPAASEYLTAYLIEKSLSLDNVFVFAVIFSSFAVPKRHRYHVLFYGVLGAIVFRLVFVLLGAALLSTFAWLVFVFGAFLVFTGVRMLRGSDEPVDPRSSKVLRLVRRRVPMTADYDGDNFFVRHGAKRYATPLLAVLVVIESSDIIFAVDSVPAVLSVTQSTFVAYASIVFAVLGLRALYFALEGLIDRFVYLHYGLAAILVFLGSEFVLQGFELHTPVAVTLTFIAAAITAAVAGSLIATRGRASTRRSGERDQDGAENDESQVPITEEGEGRQELVAPSASEAAQSRTRPRSPGRVITERRHMAAVEGQTEGKDDDGRATVVVGTDGSDAALHAGEHATALAKGLGGNLFVLNVVDPDETFHDGVHYGEPMEALTRRGNEATGKVAALAAASGVDCEEHVVRGEPARTIVEVADELGAHYLFLGAEGMSRVRRAIVGSVSQDVLRRAERPVVFLVGGGRPADDPSAPRPSARMAPSPLPREWRREAETARIA